MRSKLYPLFMIFLGLATIASSVMMYIQGRQMDILREDNAALSQQSDELNNQILTLTGNLLQKNLQLEELGRKLGLSTERITELQDANSDLSTQNETLQQEITSTISNLDQYESQIQDSMAWFRNNADIGSYGQYDDIKQELKSNCVQIANQSCHIKLSCLSYVNTQLEKFSYELDTQTTDKEDFLQDLAAIYTNKGGDCEDFSQLAFAELNYLKGYCFEQNATSISFQSFQDESGAKHYVNFNEDYYVPDTKDYELPSDFSFYYPTCGSFPASFDPQQTSQDSFGHCLLAFSNRSINAASDVYGFMQKAILVEPQNGALIADLSHDNESLIPSDDYPQRENYIFMVYTNQDLYNFNVFKNAYRWYGYADFLTEINSLRSRLQDL